MKKTTISTGKPKAINVYVTPRVETLEKRIESVTLLLSSLLSNEISLYVKTRRFDWNVSKENSIELHKLFQFQYLQIEESIKEITNRINKLGFKSVEAMTEFLQMSFIDDVPSEYPSSKDMIMELLIDHEIMIVDLRDDIGDIYEKYSDVDTADFLISRMEAHETMARLLRRATLSQKRYLSYLHN